MKVPIDRHKPLISLGFLGCLNMINKLNISYPDFRIGQVIDPEKFDENNKQIQNKINEIIDEGNAPHTYPSTNVDVDGTSLDVVLSEIDDTISNHKLLTSSDHDGRYFTKSEVQDKLDGLNNYIHPTSDGNKHVPATGTINNGKVLKAGATAIKKIVLRTV